MDWFLVKKSFFDGWDNLLGLFLSNIIYTATFTGFVFIGGVFSKASENLQLSVLVLFLIPFCLYSVGVSSVAFNYSHYKSGLFRGFISGIRQRFCHFFLLWGMNITAVIIPFIGIPFYISSGIAGAYLICCLLAFFEFYLLLSMQYFFPLAFTFPDDSPLQTFVKAFRMTGENFCFSVFLAFVTAFKIAVSIATLMLIPGFTGISLLHNNAVKLILIRNRWMQENNCFKKYKINYRQMLEEESMTLGKRSLKNLFFPWKNK